MPAPLPPDEPDRLDALRRLRVLDTPPESEYDDLTRLASAICGTPISLVSLIDADRQWFKSRVGLAAAETPRDLAFCAHAIHRPDLFVVPDAAADERFAANPLVTGDPHIRFYAGMPLTTPAGHALGTLCVIDRTPRTLSADQRDALRVLARQVVANLLLRQHVADLERERAERRASDERFRAIFDSTYQYIGLLAPDGTVLEANRTALQSAGVALADVAGKPFWEAVWWAHNPDLQSLLKHGIEQAASGEFVRFEATHPLADGTLAAIDFSITPIRDEGGTVVLLVPEGRDVTDRKRTEDRLRESEGRFQAFMDNSPAVAYMVDEVGRVVYINEPMKRQFGITDADWLGKDEYERFPADIARDMQEKNRAVLAGGKPVVVQEHTPAPDGTLHVWRSYKFPLTDAAGRRLLGGLAINVTAEKRAEDALRVSEGRLRLATRSADVGIWEWNVRTGEIHWDAEMFRLYGVPPTPTGFVPYDTWSGAVFPDDLPEQERVLGDTVHRMGSSKRVFRIRRRDGVVRHIEAAETVRMNDAGQAEWVVGTNVDVTARVRAEAELRASEERFRAVVEQAADAVFLHDSTGGVIDANRRACDSLGYTRDELVGMSFRRFDPFLTAADHTRLTADLGDDPHAGRSVHFHSRHRRKDGTDFPVEVRMGLVELNGRPHRLSIARDTSERVAFEERLFDYQQELELANAQLKTLATTDGLTGVKNRAAFNERLAEEYDRAVRHARPLSVVLLDVDHFKPFNDAFGHPAGDRVLKAVARSLADTVRGADIVARYGGEEFAVLLPDTDYAGAMVLAERLRRAVAGVSWDKRPITISVGVSTLSSSTDAAALVQEADDALYRSKKAGRNRVSHGSTVFTPPPARVLPVG